MSTTKLPQTSTDIRLSVPVPHVLLVTITRASALNALPMTAQRELDRIWTFYENADDLWCAVFTGEGTQAFCAGQDLKSLSMGTVSSAWGGEDGQPKTGFGGISCRASLSKPVIAAINGICFGGGMEMALACDYVVAGRHAKFAMPETKVGLAALAGGVVMMVRSCGYQRTMEFVMTGRSITADTGKEWGFVNEVVDKDKVLERALEVANEITTNSSPDAVRATKKGALLSLQVGDFQEATWKGQQSKESKAMLTGKDLAEGVAAFVGKRAPKWKGLSKL
ncbi:ClpP/crotonase-like domain-containing protein [Cladochytrium replicatum]|nr:ClpP/crotonase-like domain-containing protein [Cladochytrium replicatum]